MKTIKLIQGGPEWLQYRAAHHNASDAPAMLGISPHKSRADLIREVATGVAPEVDAATAARFVEGHRIEALARPVAEQVIGDDLYPVVGEADGDAKLSASFDGLTLDESVAWEHKTLNDAIRAAVFHGELDTSQLPEMYRAQMEQQCIVSGATRVLFMASRWEGNDCADEACGWYTPDPTLRARIVAGWAQFDADVAAYQAQHSGPQVVPAQPVGRTPETLPALRVEARGMVTFSNLAEFKAGALAVLGAIKRELKTDEDFADAESTVKWCKGVESKLEATKAQVLGQMQTVDEAVRTIDDVAAETRRVRLELDRLVKAEKEHRKAEIVQHYADQVRRHYAEINKTLGEFAMRVPASLVADIGAAIKGLKTLGSITDAADAACANAKIAASQQAERVRQNIAVLDEFADHRTLFSDRYVLVPTKTPEDLRNLCAARVAEAQQREAARLEAERQRIRAEEQAKSERVAQAAAINTAPACPPPTLQDWARSGAPETVTADRNLPPLKLGDIKAMIAPLSITAAGLAQLGFQPIGRDKAATLYAAADWPRIAQAMVDRIRSGQLERAA